MSALSAAEPDKTYTERLIDDALEQGDIQKATDLGKQGLKSTTSALATAGLLATGAGAFGALPADIVNTGFGLHGLYNAASKNGIRKTIRLAKEHDIPGTIQSGLGDALDLTMGLNTLRLGTRLGKSLINGSTLGNAYRSDVAGRELANNISKTVIPESDITKNILAGKIGWGPSTSNTLWHNSDKPLTKLKVDYPAWDVTERNAPLGHVWLSDRETTSGFLAKRPYHLKSKVTLNKPMVQIGEAIGNGKNATRNEILDFAQKSNADALQFKNIADNQLTGQNISAVFKDINLQPKISEAEKLGIPKSLRTGPKALEDPYYWGYQQWNSRYNNAVNSENLEEIQRLRDLHFKIKAPYTAAENVVSHGSKTSDNTFNIFNTDIRKNGWNGELTGGAFFGSGDQQALNQFARDSKLRQFYLNIEKPNTIDAQNRRYDNLLATWLTPEEVETRVSELRKNGFSESSIKDWLNKTAYGGTAEDYAVKTMSDKNYDSLIIKNIYEGGMSKDYGTPITDYVATKPTQIKLWDPKTYDNAGEIIPIVKRDNFHNPDIRYKQGGIL